MGMTENELQEKVIEGLECCREMDNPPGWIVGGCIYCPYKPLKGKEGCAKKLKEDAIALLKAQEPVEPTLDIRHGKSMWRCGSCSTALQPNNMNAKFCFNCGQAVKWE